MKNMLSGEIKDTIGKSQNPSKTVENEWFIIGESVIGKSHIQSDRPCQDSHHYEKIGNKWGIAIISDGAGSAKNSHIGSAYVAKEAIPEKFKKMVIEQGWHISDTLPSQDDWNHLAQNTLKEVRISLDAYAEQEKKEIRSLGCTVIVVIFSPNGFLVTHIGDGRAGYRNMKNEWKPMLTPWKGEEANETVFITSAIWKKPDDYIESLVIREKASAFTLMSDGCEKHSFECSKFDNVKDKWSDPNEPYPKFFEPVLKTLKSMKENKMPVVEISEKWKIFLEKGNKGLTNEPDDKTMIIGLLI
ncbi:PP2C family serine/threonine-protein phosphatase [Desulfococcaceae bacterium HSG7]|nr:PP2C family serine/threonine-protein phosphatase [Desulfococcaceae bacterium HSG7]